MSDKIGILFSAYGDIDSLDELEGYFKRSFVSFLPDILGPLKSLLANIVWPLRREEMRQHYESFGVNTHYRENSQQQADKIQQNLRELGSETTTYIGFNFAKPYIPTALQKAQQAGVTKLIVVNQGAAYSEETTQKDFDEVIAYLNKHPEWKPKAIGLKSFARDDRFIDLLGEKIKSRLDTTFSGVPAEDMCVFLPIHGVPLKAVEAGDPYKEQSDYIFDSLQNKFSNYIFEKGYQNHPFLFVKWTQPNAESVAVKIGRNSCKNVFIDGQISFTIDNSETLGDEAVEFKNTIIEEAQAVGKEKEKVFVEPMFNGDDRFAKVMADILADVLQGKGDIIALN